MCNAAMHFVKQHLGGNARESNLTILRVVWQQSPHVPPDQVSAVLEHHSTREDAPQQRTTDVAVVNPDVLHGKPFS